MSLRLFFVFGFIRGTHFAWLNAAAEKNFLKRYDFIFSKWKTTHSFTIASSSNLYSLLVKYPAEKLEFPSNKGITSCNELIQSQFTLIQRFNFRVVGWALRPFRISNGVLAWLGLKNALFPCHHRRVTVDGKKNFWFCCTHLVERLGKTIRDRMRR